MLSLQNNISPLRFLNMVVGKSKFKIDSVERDTGKCFHYKASLVDATGMTRYAWVKIYPMYKFNQGDQTYQEMDAHYKAQESIAKLTSAHLTKIYSTFDKKDSPQYCSHHIVVMKHYKDGNLLSFITNNWLALEPFQKNCLMESLCKAVEHLHNNRFSHNNITPEHIMVDQDTAYLGGLSSSKHHPEGLPQAARLKDLENLGGCLCFIEFGQAMDTLSVDQMKSKLQTAEHIGQDLRPGLFAWLDSKARSQQGAGVLINNHEIQHNTLSFTLPGPQLNPKTPAERLILPGHRIDSNIFADVVYDTQIPNVGTNSKTKPVSFKSRIY
jgi:serine/threonine protein kinase